MPSLPDNFIFKTSSKQWNKRWNLELQKFVCFSSDFEFENGPVNVKSASFLTWDLKSMLQTLQNNNTFFSSSSILPWFICGAFWAPSNFLVTNMKGNKYDKCPQTPEHQREVGGVCKSSIVPPAILSNTPLHTSLFVKLLFSSTC